MKKFFAVCTVLMVLCFAAGIVFAACGTCGSGGSSCPPICNCVSCDKECSCKCKYCEKKMNENLTGMCTSVKGAGQATGAAVCGAGKEAGTVAQGAHLTFDDMCKGCLKTSSDIVVGARDSTSRILGGVADSYDGIMNGLSGQLGKKSTAAASDKKSAVEAKPEKK